MIDGRISSGESGDGVGRHLLMMSIAIGLNGVLRAILMLTDVARRRDRLVMFLFTCEIICELAGQAGTT